jgi:hypothetical protein
MQPSGLLRVGLALPDVGPLKTRFREDAPPLSGKASPTCGGWIATARCPGNDGMDT